MDLSVISQSVALIGVIAIIATVYICTHSKNKDDINCDNNTWNK